VALASRDHEKFEGASDPPSDSHALASMVNSQMFIC
jgi:hypothetical protein